MNHPNPLRALTLGTLTVMSILITSTSLFGKTSLPASIEIDTVGQPTMGSPQAVVHVVVFEELKCPACARFSNNIFPALKQKFIDTNKILYTVIPVSFINNSMPVAVALLCAYHQDEGHPNSAQFFKYLEYIFRNMPSEATDWATIENLEKMAKAASPAIDLKKLKSCVEKETYSKQITKNTQYGASIMNGRLTTPSVFVNGIKAEELSMDSLSKLIEDAGNNSNSR